MNSERAELESEENDEHRTAKELTKSMCALVDFLELTSVEESMFSNGRLPTLDAEICKKGAEIEFSFYENPQVPNRVLLKDTALPEQTIRSSIIQEVVRRMQNCCEKIGIEERQEKLLKLASKMMNSGRSQKSIKIMNVQGVTK